MNYHREILELGVIGKVPTDSLFELCIESRSGDVLTFYQTRSCASLGGWVYDAAVCLAKYLESEHFNQHFGKSNPQNALLGRRVVELGAGTGIVGIMAAYYGASVVTTDLDPLIPLIDYNIKKNNSVLKGDVKAKTHCWGCKPDDDLIEPDFLIFANCVYYENSLEMLLDTILSITSQCHASTVILACYEERTKEIRALVTRWHVMLLPYFEISDVPWTILDPNYTKDYVRVVTMSKRCC
jgi:hypothetical protein